MSGFDVAKAFSGLGRLAKGASFGKAGRMAADVVGIGPDVWKSLLAEGATPAERLLTGAGAVQGGLFGASIGLPLAEGAYHTFTRQRAVEKTEHAEFVSRSHLLGIRMEAERRAREAAMNAQILAQTNPELYKQLLAGRKLPRGAIVIGGRPRMDLLEQVASEMGSGAYDPPPSAEQEFLSSIS